MRENSGRECAEAGQWHSAARALFTVTLMALLSLAIQAGEIFHYTTPAGISLSITEAGLTEIRQGETLLASGDWQALSLPQEGVEPLPAATARRLAILDGDSAEVIHQHGDEIRIEYTYRCSGEDIHIQAQVCNQSEAELGEICFQGLQFSFPQSPSGLALLLQPGELPDIASCHPGPANPIGGSFLTAGGWGVGLSPANPEDLPTLLTWQPGEGKKLSLHYLCDARIWAEGARTFGLTLRLSPNTTEEHLLTPYRLFFQKRFGHTAGYSPGPRTLVYFDIPAGAERITESNPLGYLSEENRFDRPEAVEKWTKTWIPVFRTAGVDGIILEDPAGYDPRGLDYDTSFNLMPPEVVASMTRLQQAFNEAGMRLGITGRANALEVRVSGESSRALTIDANQPLHLEHIWKYRFQPLLAGGFSLFRLPQFGESLADIAAMKSYRGQMGREIPTYAGVVTDRILLHSAGILTLHWNELEQSYATASEIALSRRLRWLLPDAELVAEPAGELTPERLKAFLTCCRTHRLTPLLTPAQARMAGVDSASEEITQ